MTAGRLAKFPKCATILKNGARCRQLPLEGSDRCRLHLGGAEREAWDLKRQPGLILIANGHRNRGEAGRAQAIAQLACMERRRLRRAWQSNPLIAGATFAMERHVERQVRAYLRDMHDFDIDAVVAETGKPLTPRAVDRIWRAAYYGFTGKSDFPHVARRLHDAVGDDIRFWKRMQAFDVREED